MVGSKLFQSKTGNNYLFSKSIPQILLIHPIMKYLIRLKKDGRNIPAYINKLGDNLVKINNAVKASGKDLQYYYDYICLLKKSSRMLKRKNGSTAVLFFK